MSPFPRATTARAGLVGLVLALTPLAACTPVPAPAPVSTVPLSSVPPTSLPAPTAGVVSSTGSLPVAGATAVPAPATLPAGGPAAVAVPGPGDTPGAPTTTASASGAGSDVASLSTASPVSGVPTAAREASVRASSVTPQSLPTAVSSQTPAETTAPPPQGDRAPAYAASARLARSVNMCGNMEFEWWRPPTEAEYEAAARAGFTAARICISWGFHQADAAPWTIDPAIFTHVDNAVAWARARGMAVVIDNHYDDQLTADPAANRDRWLAATEQVARHYAHHGDDVMLELLNEPHDQLTPDLWNQYVRDALERVRAVSPTRVVVVDTAEWGSIGGLPELTLPETDPYLIVSAHHYEPFPFTHQGAEWASPVPPVGVRFPRLGPVPTDAWESWSPSDGMSVTYDGSGAVVASQTRIHPYFWLARALPVPRATGVRFTVSVDMPLWVWCFADPRSDWPQPSATVTASANVPVTVPASACGPDTGEIGSIIVAAAAPSAGSTFVVTGVEVLTADGPRAALGPDELNATAPVRALAEYGRAHNRPVWLGEFGVYHKAVHADRVYWTRLVRQECERQGIGWSYWNFDGGGFQLYDQPTGTYDVELVRALLPETPIR